MWDGADDTACRSFHAVQFSVPGSRIGWPGLSSYIYEVSSYIYISRIKHRRGIARDSLVNGNGRRRRSFQTLKSGVCAFPESVCTLTPIELSCLVSGWRSLPGRVWCRPCVGSDAFHSPSIPASDSGSWCFSAGLLVTIPHSGNIISPCMFLLYA